eukprot:8986605-Lingulodinium_polyedra.AAC.1
MEAMCSRVGRTTGWAPGFVLGAITLLWGIEGAPSLPHRRGAGRGRLGQLGRGPAPAQRRAQD